MKKKRIAVIDKTGRGHSICDALIRTNRDIEVYYIPGTGGVFDSRIKTVQNISITDKIAIVEFCQQKNIELAIVSHIDALCFGVSDAIRAKGIPTLGVSADCTVLESSKWLCKRICALSGILTSSAKLIESKEEMEEHVQVSVGHTYMIKADWLTVHGNGAIRVKENDTVSHILKNIETIILQNPGHPFRFVIEEYVFGRDYSAHYIVNQGNCIDMPSCLDYKKSHDNDDGMNCDGMGSVSPHPLETNEIKEKIKREILYPLIEGLRCYGIEYDGPIYLGLRIAGEKIYLLEVNTRFGDSESEAMFPLVNEDLCQAILSFIGQTSQRAMQFSENISLVISIVVGSPVVSSYKNNEWPFAEGNTGLPIQYTGEYIAESTRFYWANVNNTTSGKMITGYGRIAHIVCTGKSIKAVREKVYSSLPAIQFEGIRWRNDIGSDISNM